MGNALVEAVLGEISLCGPKDISAATVRHLACCSHACLAFAFVGLGGCRNTSSAFYRSEKRALHVFGRFVKTHRL